MTMCKVKKCIANTVVKVCENAARKEANQACMMFVYQPKRPDCLKKSGK